MANQQMDFLIDQVRKTVYDVYVERITPGVLELEETGNAKERQMSSELLAIMKFYPIISDEEDERLKAGNKGPPSLQFFALKALFDKWEKEVSPPEIAESREKTTQVIDTIMMYLMDRMKLDEQ